MLARLSLPEGAALPPELESLAREIVLAPTLERAEALATAIAPRRAARSARRRPRSSADAAEAKRLLDEHAATTRRRRCCARSSAWPRAWRAWTPRCATRRRATLDDAAADRERQEQAAAALVLQESLRDLGYDVDDIEATLFVDGGTVHFRREGWDNYFVRLRVDPRERTVNFNVVRAQRRRGERRAKAPGRAGRRSLVRRISAAAADAGSARPRRST